MCADESFISFNQAQQHNTLTTEKIVTSPASTIMAEAEEIDDTTSAATGWVAKLSRYIVAPFSSLLFAHAMDDASKSNQIVVQPATTISKRTFDWMHFYIGVRVQGKDGKININ